MYLHHINKYYYEIIEFQDLTFALEDVMENLEPSDDVEYAKDFIKYSLAIVS